MKRSLYLLVAIGFFVSPVLADDGTTHSVSVGGAGTDLCSLWAKDRAADSEQSKKDTERRIEWISGFFSAVNFFTSSSGNLHGGIDDRDGMLSWIDKHCQANPNDPLFAASIDLVFDLRNHPRK
jgi:hypothetical protein